MKKIIYSLLLLINVGCAKNNLHMKVSKEIFDCKQYYKPQDLIAMQGDDINIIEANIQILLNRIKDLKQVIQCQQEQINIFIYGKGK